MIKQYLVALQILALLTPATLQAMPKDEADIKAFEEMFPEDQPGEIDFLRNDRLLVTATGSQKPLHLAPSVASVITKEDIEAIGATSLLEVLETVPGLHVGISPLNAMEPVYSFRGIQTNITPQTLILLNGTPINMALTGAQVTTFKMPVNFISRIEVVRGPGSAIHGADAFSGVINIITKDGWELDGTRAGVRYGSFDTTNTWLQHGNDYNGWNIAMSLDYQKSQGDNDRKLDDDLQSTLDSLINTPNDFPAASLTPGELETQYEIFDTHLAVRKDNWTVRLWGWLADDAGRGDGVTSSLSNGSSADGKQCLVDMIYTNDELHRDFDYEVRLNYYYYKVDAFLQLFPDGTVLPLASDGNVADPRNPAVGIALFSDGAYGNPIQTGWKNSLDFTTLYSGWLHHKWRFAMGFRHEDEEYEEYKNFGPGVLDNPPAFQVVDGSLTSLNGTDDIYMPDSRRDIWHLSLQDEWDFVRLWSLTAGVRYDHYSDFGDTVNPRVALVWQTTPELTSKLMYGRAFRAPSFNELYIQNNPANTGNSDLDPETIDSYDLSFRYEPLGTLVTKLSFFYYEIDDLIDQVVVGNTLQAENAKDQEGYGFELEADWQVSKNLRLRGNLARQRSKDRDTDEITVGAPGWQAYANANWQFKKNWSVDGQYFWIGDRHRADGDSKSDIDDYDVVNLTLRRKNIAERWDMAVAVRNLFDEDVREPSSSNITNDYPMESRAIWAEIRMHF